MSCSSRIIIKMLPEIHTMEKFDFLSLWSVGPRSAVGSASDSRERGPGFKTRSGHIFSFRVSADSRTVAVSYWRKNVHEVLVNRLGDLSLSRKSVVRLTDRPDMTIVVYRGQ